MKSVGEVMAIGRNVQKSRCKSDSFAGAAHALASSAETPDRSFVKNRYAATRPHSLDSHRPSSAAVPDVESATSPKIDPWFISRIQELTQVNKRAAGVTVETASKELLREVKRQGTSERAARANVEDDAGGGSLAARTLWRCSRFKRVDTCAAEF